jgi:hypothetical protein
LIYFSGTIECAVQVWHSLRQQWSWVNKNESHAKDIAGSAGLWEGHGKTAGGRAQEVSERARKSAQGECKIYGRTLWLKRKS